MRLVNNSPLSRTEVKKQWSCTSNLRLWHTQGEPCLQLFDYISKQKQWSHSCTCKSEVRTCTVPRLRRSTAGLTSQWPRFDPRSVRVSVLTGKSGTGTDFSPSTSVSPVHRRSILTHSFIHPSRTLYDVRNRQRRL